MAPRKIIYIVTILYCCLGITTCLADGNGSGKPVLVAQLGHPGGIGSANMSPDGRYVLTAGGDPTPTLWEAATGREIRQFSHPDGVNSAVLSPNGKYVLTTCNWEADLWETATGEKIRRFKGHESVVHSAVFSPDGRYVLTASGEPPDFSRSGGTAEYRSGDFTARIWDVKTGKEVRRFTGHKGAVRSAVFSTDGQYVLTASNDKTARLWEASTGKQIRVFKGHLGLVSSAIISPSGRNILTVSASRYEPTPTNEPTSTVNGDHTIRLWDTATVKELRRVTARHDQFPSAVFSANGRSILTAGLDGGLKLWDTAKGKELPTLKVHDDRALSATFSPGGRYIVSTDNDAVRIWDPATGREIQQFKGYSTAVWSAVFSADGLHILMANADDTSRVWEAARGQEVRVLKIDQGAHSAVFSPDGRYVLTADCVGPDGYRSGPPYDPARLWDAVTGNEIRQFKLDSGDVKTAVFSEDGHYVVTTSVDSTVRLWETASGKEVRKFSHGNGTMRTRSALLSPDNRYLLAIWDGVPMLWDAITGKETRQFKGSRYCYTAVFSTDGQLVLTATENGGQVWEASTGKQILKFEDNSSMHRFAVFSPDARNILAVDGESNTARMLDSVTGKEIRQFIGHSDAVRGTVFSPDGRFVMTASDDATTRLWEAGTGKELCRLISFTDGTWAVTDPQGRYDASNGGDVDGLHWVVGNEAIDLKQLKSRYYDPGLLAKYLGYNKEPLRNVQAFDNVKLYPEVAVSQNPANLQKVSITLANRGGGIGKVQILVNGKEVRADARGLRPNSNAAKLTLPLDLAPYRNLLIPGQENTLEVIAYNGEGWLASRGAKLVIPAPKDKPADRPKLYAIVGGINDYSSPELHLRFAAKDAEDFATALALGARRLFGVDKVEIMRLTGTGASGSIAPTRANFAAAFAGARKLRAQDVFVVYLAGHGVALGRGSDLYCYLTQEARAADSVTLSDITLRHKTAITSDELTDWIKQIPANKQVMILDTCAAGAFSAKLAEKRDINGDQVRALDRLKDRTGFQILMGCAADRVSYEATRYGQGVLTYALLQGMKGAALKPDGEVDISSLFQYAVDNVPRLAGDIGGIQRPQVCAPRAASFPVGRMEKEDEEKVPLEKSYPLILRPILTDVDAGFDSLKLMPAVRKSLNDLLAPETRGKGDSALVVYVDGDEMPGAITPSGTYSIQGDMVKVRLILRQDDKTIETRSIEGPKNDLGSLVKMITQKIAEAAQKH